MNQSAIRSRFVFRLFHASESGSIHPAARENGARYDPNSGSGSNGVNGSESFFVASNRTTGLTNSSESGALCSHSCYFVSGSRGTISMDAFSIAAAITLEAFVIILKPAPIES